MGKPRTFYTGPVRAIGDARLSGVDHRVLHCVSLHDGMSLVKGTGRGCYATFATLTGEIGTDPSNLSKSLKRLVEWGYLAEEQQTDRRCKSYRVIFDPVTPSNAGDSWRNDQQSFVDETANDPPEIVGNEQSGNGGNPPRNEQHYSSLKGLDTPEGVKLDSDESAHLNGARLAKTKFSENVGAQLAKFEREWKAGASISEATLLECYDWLFKLSEDADPSDPVGQRALRLYYNVDAAAYERKCGPYAAAAVGAAS